MEKERAVIELYYDHDSEQRKIRERSVFIRGFSFLEREREKERMI